MEMKVVITGSGASIPKTDIGINLLTYAYIQLRFGMNDKPITLAVSDSLSFGAKSGTFILGFAKTEWFYVDTDKHKWLSDYLGLIGKKVELDLAGTLIVNGTVDLKFTVYGKDREEKEMISKVDIESSGGQISGTKVRGNLLMIQN
jgi:hypothetical protein